MKLSRSLILCAFASLSLEQPCRAASVVDAIHHVESGGYATAPMGDGGRARGPLQVHRACWKDSGIAGRWEDCDSLEYSKRVFTAYCARYHATTPEQQARLWNAGPSWRAKIHATDLYWARVREAMR